MRYEFELKDRIVEVNCTFETKLMDGKTRKAMSGRGGAYCYHCSTTKEKYHTAAGVRVEVNT